MSMEPKGKYIPIEELGTDLSVYTFEEVFRAGGLVWLRVTTKSDPNSVFFTGTRIEVKPESSETVVQEDSR